MNPICTFRIPTQDLGLGNYHTIPLKGKDSYKVANHSNNRSMCFSIIAYMMDPKTDSMVCQNATRQWIDFALRTSHSDVKVSSATGEGHVNIKPFQAKENNVARKFKSIGGGWSNPIIGFAGVMQGMVGSIQSLVKLDSFKSEESLPKFQFSITAHKTADTKLTFQGSLTLKELADRLVSVGAWGDGATLTEMAKDWSERITTLNECRTNITDLFFGKK